MKKLNFRPPPKKEKGFAALFSIILVLAIMLGVSFGITALILGEQKISRNIIKSSQAYYAAEAGIEDAIYRLSENKQWINSYSLDCGGGTTSVVISEIIGGSRTITSQGDISNRIRKIQLVYSISVQEVSFHYGAQVGDGGMLMANNSRIKGNLYSNGNVQPAQGGDKGYIDNTVVVARNGNRIEGLQVGGDAKAHSCKNSTIAGTLTYVSGGSLENCSAGSSIKSQPNEIPPKDLPISQTMINGWKADAEAGGIITGDYTISGKVTESLGPVKITGNMIIENNAILNVTGTVWVVGNLTVQNGATIKLSLNHYGFLSGIVIADGKIKIRQNTSLRGSGQPGSYLLLLSTNTELLDTANPAIDVDNNADAAIFEANEGLIVLRNKIKAREVVGYKILLSNNAEILYESGLQDSMFSSGPGGSWEVLSWQEIE